MGTCEYPTGVGICGKLAVEVVGQRHYCEDHAHIVKRLREAAQDGRFSSSTKEN
jgi:hypothetical protein